MDKFGRKYSFEIQTSSNTILTVELPFTLEFDVTRNILSSSNTSSIRLYNLSEDHRKQIYKDRFAYDLIKAATLKAGYGDNIPVIFDGNVSQAWSVREGNNFITQIESYDGGFSFANGITSESFPEGTEQADILKTLLNSLPDATLGAIGSFPGSLVRGNTYSGSTTDILTSLTGGGFFIDNGKSYCLGDSECLRGEIEVISSDTGLLGTPVREETYLTFDILFEPRLIIGQRIKLDSKTGSNFNGFYKVVSVKHRGMISDTVCGDAITTVGLFYGSKSLTVID